MIQIMLFLALIGPAYCQTSSTYELTADEVECNQKTHQCRAQKNARVVTGPKDQTKILTAEVITASLQDQDASSQPKAQVIEAEGHVLLEVQGDKIQFIRAQQARYEPDSQKAVFKGNVQLRFGPHVFKGDEATADLNQGHFVLKRSGQTPVSGLVYPEAIAKDRRRA